MAQAPVGNARGTDSLAFLTPQRENGGGSPKALVRFFRMSNQPEPVQDVTEVLAAGAAGDPRAADRLLTLVYSELRALAQSHLAGGGGADQTLQATAIVHEAYLR